MIVVSNAGPLIALARIEKLDLLQSLYCQVRIPLAVTSELKGRGEQQYASFHSVAWLKDVEIKDKMAVALLQESLGAGESEAIVLAMESNADLLLMDEERGRRIAVSRQLNLVGTLGILVLAKRRKLIRFVGPLLDELLTSGFRMSADLARNVLELAGEGH